MWCTVLALFHCLAWYGTVQFTFGGFSTGYSTWYLVLFSVLPRLRFQVNRTITKTWRETLLIWLEKIISVCVIELVTRDTTDLLDLNQHSQRRIERNCLNERTFFYQSKQFCFVVCWGNTDIPLVYSRGADPARAWWSEAEWKSISGVTAQRE